MVVPLVIGLLFCLGGTLAYTGRWRSWTAGYLISPYAVFGATYLGLGLLFALPILRLHGRHPVITAAAGVGLVVCWALFLLSLRWLPVRLRPGWFREWQARGSVRGDYVRVRTRRG